MTKHAWWIATSIIFSSLVTSHAQSFMYVSDAGNFNLPPWKIFKFDVNGANGEVFIDDHLDWPQDIVFLEDKNVMLVSNLNSGEIVRFNATTGEYMNTFATGIGGPTRMKIGPDSLLYVLQWNGNGNVWRYTLNGSYVDQFTTVGVVDAIGLDWDAAGNLYVSSYNGKYVQKYSSSGADMGKFISTNLAGPTNIWFDSSGDLLINDYTAANVKRFDSNGNFKSVFISGVPQAEGVDFLPNGDILIGVGGAAAIRQYNAAGQLVGTPVPSGTLGLKTPNAVVLRHLSTTSTHDAQVYKDMNIVTPSTGTQFKFVGTDVIPDSAMAEISNSSGMIVHKTMLNDSTVWNASALPAGMYIITVVLSDNTIARQKIFVQ